MNIKLLKTSIITFIYICLPFILCSTAYALTESEIQSAVASQGKEAVSGNIFIWFLCAVAFLKISQKIDSFMSGLGVNVGRTGGSMMTEAMIAARALGVGGKGLLNKGFGGGGSSQGGGSGEKGGVLSGGLAGVVGRNINNSAMNAATGKDAGLFGKKAFESSLKNSGDLAKDVIGKVAKGDISKNGSITGETANKALGTYLGYDSDNAVSGLAVIGGEPAVMPTDAVGIDINSDNIAPAETANSHDTSVDPESTVASGSSIESGISAEGMPVESMPQTSIDSKIPESENQVEMQTESDIAIGGEKAALLDTGSGSGIAIQSETEVSDSTSAKSSNPDTTVNAGEQAAMSQSSSLVSETAIPLSGATDGMPELPEITPDYINAGDSAHSVSSIPEGQSSIPSSAGSSVTSMQPSTVSGGSAAVSSTVSKSESADSSIKQTADKQGGAPPVTITSSGANVSSSNNQAQSNTVANTSSSSIDASAEVSSTASVTQQENINSSVSVPADNPVSVPAPVDVGNNDITGNQPQLMDSNGLPQNEVKIPMFSDVEIGGGRITGTETSDKFPDGIEFGMYNTAQYMKPDGAFTTVETVDGAKWYKQYAADKVEKTPVVESSGKIKYEEKIVKKMPPVPRRKDKV